jgi:transcriptional regulator with XRE-family HTH domain
MDVKIGERIRLHRILSKMSRAELAKRFGITEQAIGMYERGDREPNIEQIKSLATMFEVSTDYLLGQMPLSDEAKFLSMIDLSIDEIMARQKVTVDGKQLSEKEVAWIVSSIRSYRDFLDPSDS